MSSKNQSINKDAEFIFKVFTYAMDHHLDIENKKDVTRMLKVLDPKKTNEQYIEVFMPMLEIMRRMVEAEVATRS